MAGRTARSTRVPRSVWIGIAVFAVVALLVVGVVVSTSDSGSEHKNAPPRPATTEPLATVTPPTTIRMSTSGNGGGPNKAVDATRPPPEPVPVDCSRTFVEGPSSVNTSQALAAGMVGTWKGCVTTPWVRPYLVTLIFHGDGTYASYSDEPPPETAGSALYYGTDGESPLKRYRITDFAEAGYGWIAIHFGPTNTTVEDRLETIKLMGNKLSFEMIHAGRYGPLRFQLYRQ